MQMRTTWGLFCLLLLAGAVFLPGCESRMLWAYRDDPYLRDYAARGEAYCMKKLKSVYADDRQVALRTLAQMAANARAQQDNKTADRLVGVILDRFKTERDASVRVCIVRLCAPVCGVNAPQVHAFLRTRIAEGQYAREAIESLAVLTPDDLTWLLPLAQHPSAEMRYTVARALLMSGNPTGAATVHAIVNEMKPPLWPQTLGGMSLADARQNLHARATQLWGSVPLQTAPPPSPRLAKPVSTDIEAQKRVVVPPSDRILDAYPEADRKNTGEELPVAKSSSPVEEAPAKKDSHSFFPLDHLP